MPIPLTSITIPTPEPYDSQHPSRQWESLCYVLLQVLDLTKTAGGSINKPTDLLDAVNDLQYNGQVFDFGQFRVFCDGKTATIT